jgi:DNA-directed RNA polymerase subunit K/omega
VIRPPHAMGTFEFVAIAALRAAQLTRGCRPRVDGDHTTAVLAQREVAEGKVTSMAYGTPQVADVHVAGNGSTGEVAG